jgi:hypothetical protein
MKICWDEGAILHCESPFIGDQPSNHPLHGERAYFHRTFDVTMEKNIFAELRELRSMFSGLIGTADVPEDWRFSVAALDKVVEAYQTMSVVVYGRTRCSS